MRIYTHTYARTSATKKTMKNLDESDRWKDR
ncbi:hypothetical protein CGMCC3_g11746 [Colletotrichum fructicola]|nr:uncharacterized protein CGMCC3_g11746 [Colletotrichum fructicola]KAE9572325.1 hypothetical protein CGMCC3_g11746 [Colletotrichum fructicola]